MMMKHVLLSLTILIINNAYSQTALVTKSQSYRSYVIVDRKLKKPLRVADTVTKEQLTKGFFVIEKRNVDSVISKLQLLHQRLQIVAREKYDEFIWSVGSTTLSGKVVKWTYADRFNVALSTDTGSGYSPAFYIVDARHTNKDNATYLKKLIAYIQKGLK